MKYPSIGRCALTGIVSLGALMAQPATTPGFLQGVSTGIVSFSLNQTAQLNVVNLNPVMGTPGATATVCSVQLQFFDGSGGMIKQVTLPNVAPGASASLNLKRAEAPDLAVPRFAIRGVVRTNPVTPTAGTGTAIPILYSGCPVKTTLEIYNDDTGNTQLVTSDVQSITSGILPPLIQR